jgi:uncharacterized membrane protein YhhN
MALAFAIACALGVLATVWGEVRDLRMVKVVCKPLASLAFIGFGLTLGLATGSPATVLALVLSAVGDVALLSSERRWFLAGLGAFLLAHVAYVVAFVQLGTADAWFGAAAVGAGLFAWFVWGWLGPHVGSMARPVQAYVLVICTMGATAAGVAGVEGPGRSALLVGALVFVASDLCVARQRFIQPEPLNRVIGLPLYYGAQLLIAWSVAEVAGSLA